MILRKTENRDCRRALGGEYRIVGNFLDDRVRKKTVQLLLDILPKPFRHGQIEKYLLAIRWVGDLKHDIRHPIEPLFPGTRFPFERRKGGQELFHRDDFLSPGIRILILLRLLIPLDPRHLDHFQIHLHGLTYRDTKTENTSNDKKSTRKERENTEYTEKRYQKDIEVKTGHIVCLFANPMYQSFPTNPFSTRP